MEFPETVKSSRLWQRLSCRSDHLQAVADIRSLAEALGKQIERVLPDYTDHSVTHMDALWTVADAVMKPDELARCSQSEIFLLACTFYIHDLAMSVASTPEGAALVRECAPYKTTYSLLTSSLGVASEKADVLALRTASREIHGAKAKDIALKPIPGLGRFLIENTDLRERWGTLIGEVAASHHWSLEDVHTRLGRRDAVPTADGDLADLGYIACLLRIIDYAHINRERASHLERALRSDISRESALHWDAQENITGPSRSESHLVYGCTTPFTDVEAWWLFFDLASGLDAEIRRVRDYLSGRKVSNHRFSLLGVRGTEAPDAFASFVLLDSDILPIDVRVQPHSMERVVELLGGAALYRGDELVSRPGNN